MPTERKKRQIAIVLAFIRRVIDEHNAGILGANEPARKRTAIVPLVESIPKAEVLAGELIGVPVSEPAMALRRFLDEPSALVGIERLARLRSLVEALNKQEPKRK
jgi:hypothetical protein